MTKNILDGKIVLLTILFSVLFFRLLILSNSSLTFYSDDAIYAILARFLTEGNLKNFFHPTWPPLFPTISAFFYLITQNWEISLRLVSILSGVALVMPLFYLLRNTLSFAHAVLFTLALTFFYPIINLSLLPFSDMFTTFLLVTSITIIFLGLHLQKTKLLVIAAIPFGLTFLARPEGFMFFSLTLFYLSFYLIVQVFLKRKFPMKQILLIPASALVFFFVISPYLLAIRSQLGEWTLSQKFSAQIKQSHAFALGENGTTWSQEVVSARSPNYGSQYFRGGTEYVLEYSDWFVWWFNQKFRNWVSVFKEIFPIWSIPLIFIGMFNIFHKNFFWSTGYLLFVMLIAIPTTIFSTPISDVRYLLWSLPLFLFFFYQGIHLLSDIILKIIPQAKRLPSLIRLIPFWAFLLFPSFSLEAILHPLVYSQEFTRNHYRQEIMEAAEWIKKNTLKGNPRIMMRHEGIEFYAKGVTVYLPQQLTIDEVVEYAIKNRVDYLVAWSEELASDKTLSVLLEAGVKHPNLNEVYRNNDDNRTIVVYILPKD